jgi:hypothetical protein
MAEAAATTLESARRTGHVPASALRMVVGPFELGDNGEGAKSAPIRMKARTAQPVQHWFWGRVVHDMAGMRLHKDRIPIDYVHNPAEVIGYLNHFRADTDGLEVSGALVPYKDSDRASEIIHKARAGVPYEASINFGGPGIKVEEVAGGQVAQVNGFQFAGPGIVIREWPLRGVAVCPYGADMNTRSELAQGESIHVTFTQSGKETAMSEPPSGHGTPAVPGKPAEAAPPIPAPAPAVDATKTEASAEAPKPGAVDAGKKDAQAPPASADPAAAAKVAPAEAAASAGKAAPPAAPGVVELSAARAECKAFLDAFGPKGGEWFAAGKSFAEAQALHAQELRAENEALKARLAALDRGEKAPVPFQPEKRDDARAKRRAELKGKVGDNLAAFAAEIDCTKKKEGN